MSAIPQRIAALLNPFSGSTAPETNYYIWRITALDDNIPNGFTKVDKTGAQLKRVELTSEDGLFTHDIFLFSPIDFATGELVSGIATAIEGMSDKEVASYLGGRFADWITLFQAAGMGKLFGAEAQGAVSFSWLVSTEQRPVYVGVAWLGSLQGLPDNQYKALKDDRKQKGMLYGSLRGSRAGTGKFYESFLEVAEAKKLIEGGKKPADPRPAKVQAYFANAGAPPVNPAAGGQAAPPAAPPVPPVPAAPPVQAAPPTQAAPPMAAPPAAPPPPPLMG